MAGNTDRPVVFPLSNPTAHVEALPEDILEWTEGRAIVAAGSPFPPVELHGRTALIGQGNNAFIFPGLGHGAILARVREVTDGMVLAGAYALADYVAERHLAAGRVYPDVEELQEVSVKVAAAVIRQAMADGVAQQPVAGDVEARVRAAFWRPHYVPVVRAERAQAAGAQQKPRVA
jgi:malate dehydrogenase (oxaloacetate-decarboxylating)